MATTTNYSWTTPDDTALVKDGAAAIRSLGTAIDSTVFTNAGAAINKSIVDAKGDLIAATGSDAVTRVAVGTNGQYLKADNTASGGVSWDTLPSSGSLTLINTGGTTLSGASVTISSIPSTYTNLYLIVEDFLPATDQAVLWLRINGDNGSNRYYNAYFSDSGTMQGNGRTLDDTKLVLVPAQFSTSTNSLATALLPNYKNTVTFKTAIIHSVSNYNGTTGVALVGQIGVFNQTGAITSLVLLPSTGNFTSGTAYLYGVN
jgi:hypothetical protein